VGQKIVEAKFDLKILKKLYYVTFIGIEEMEVLFEVISKLLEFLLMKSVGTTAHKLLSICS
jgi:hypothetical protein